MAAKQPRRLWRLTSSLLLLATLATVLWQRQAIFDWLRLRDYQPSAAVASLATDDTMTDWSQHIFYVNHPALVSDPQTFQSDCTHGEQTIILGCYHSNQAGIYVYNVSDSRLAGITQVTSAHEMLHAAYDRLNPTDKKYVNGLLVDYFNNGLSDQRIKDTMASYKKTEPNDVINEMHSVFGTEVANLPPPLEKYYERYFKSRPTVVAFSARYESEFTSRQSRMKQYETQLSSLRAKIDSEQQSLRSEVNTVNAEKTQLDFLRSSGSTAEYNAAVDRFNSDVDSYNQKVEVYRSDVNTYNSILGQYNSIAGELKSLYQAIDASQLPTKSTQ